MKVLHYLGLDAAGRTGDWAYDVGWAVGRIFRFIRRFVKGCRDGLNEL